MKAALLNGIQDLRIVEVPTPSCSKGKVLIKLEACGICRTDMKAFYLGQRDLHLPRILGHEIAGMVVKAGARSDIVCLNAGLILYLMNLSESIQEGCKQAKEIIFSGQALEKLKEWVMAQNTEPELGLAKLNNLLSKAGVENYYN